MDVRTAHEPAAARKALPRRGDRAEHLEDLLVATARSKPPGKRTTTLLTIAAVHEAARGTTALDTRVEAQTASTTAGSNWRPAFRRSSARASSGDTVVP